MDLGIAGRTAIVCAASKGLGRACAMQLAREGVTVVISARTKADLEATAAEIRKIANVKVEAVACDVTTDEGRALIMKACPAPDILITNAGGPPPGDFKDFSLEDWRKAVEWNMITPIALIKGSVYGMMDRKFGRILNITSQSVKKWTRAPPRYQARTAGNMSASRRWLWFTARMKGPRSGRMFSMPWISATRLRTSSMKVRTQNRVAEADCNPGRGCFRSCESPIRPGTAPGAGSPK